MPTARSITLVLLFSTASQIAAQAPLERRQLTDTVVIDGITCAPTGSAYAEFHPSGRLAECPITRDTMLFGHRFPAMTWVGFDASGRLRAAWLSRNTLLNGFLCRGKGYKGYRVLFHPNGKLALCFLAEDDVIQGVPCLRGTFWTEIRGGSKSAVSFRENGRLARCQVSRDFSRDGISLRKWQLAILDTAGRLRSQQ
jgi:hypothetical protein